MIMVQRRIFPKGVWWLGIITAIWVASLSDKSQANENLVSPSHLSGQIILTPGVLEPDEAIKYSQTIVNEIILADLLSQVERGYFYAQKSGVEMGKIHDKIENLQSIYQEANRILRLSDLKQGHNITLAPPLQPSFPGPVTPPPSFPPLKPSIGPDRSVAVRGIDFNALTSLLEKGNALAKDTLQQLQSALRKKFPWFVPIEPNYGTLKKIRGKEEILANITFSLRIEDLGKDIYHDSWNWDILKPFGFDFISPHPHLYQELNPRPSEFDFTAQDRIIQTNKEHGFNSSIDIDARIPAWLLQRYGDSPNLFDPVHSELFWHNAKGETSRGVAAHSTFNIWHPEGEKALLEYIKALGERYASDPRVSVYELFNEYQMVTAGEEPAGYSQVAKEAFHRYLEEKYGTVDKLNRKWHTSFNAYNEIEPPDSLFPIGDEKLTPRLYDFEKFRQESSVNFFADIIKALKETTSNQLICSQLLGFFNGPPDGAIRFPGLDFLQLTSLAWDILGKHDQVGQDFIDARLPDLDSLYTYSINRYAKKLLWNDEFWWTAWEATRTSNEFIARAVIERNIWRQIAWGKRGLSFFTLDDNFAGMWENNLLYLPAKQVIRYPAGVIPLMKEKLQRIKGILFHSEISSHHIGILQPSTAIIVASPAWTPTHNAIKVATWLLNRHYIPFFIPEEVIINGKEDLKDIKFLIVPYATHVPNELTDKILEWIKKGGTLLSLGPLGVYNGYGERTNRFIPTIFGIKDQDLRYVVKGWRSAGGVWSAGFLGKEVKFPDGQWQLKSGADNPLIKTYGQGKAILWLGTELSPADLDNLEKVVNDTLIPLQQLKGQIINRKVVNMFPFYTKDSPYNLDLVLLDTPDGGKYLFVINLDVANEIEAEIKIKGRYTQIVEISSSGGLPVYPSFASGWTTIFVPLDPGQGLFFNLG